MGHGHPISQPNRASPSADDHAPARTASDDMDQGVQWGEAYQLFDGTYRNLDELRREADG